MKFIQVTLNQAARPGLSARIRFSRANSIFNTGFASCVIALTVAHQNQVVVFA